MEDERSGRLGSRKGDAAPTPPSPQVCLKTAAPPPTSLSPSTLFSLPPPCRRAPAAPQGATLPGICVELAASLSLVFSPLAGRI